MSIIQFESAVDAAFGSLPIPHPNLYISVWYLLTVSEDTQRLMFCIPSDHMDEWNVEYLLDRYKFSLRHCLAAVFQKSYDRVAVAMPAKIVTALCTKAHQLLASGIEYSVAAQICASAHEGTTRLIENDDCFTVEIEERILDRRYGVLEAMRQSTGEILVPPSSLLWAWILGAVELPHAVQKIADSTRVSKGRVKYLYNPDLSHWLAQGIHQPPFFIPDQWKFPWGGRRETTLLINSLFIRVLYHLCAVHFGSCRAKLRGGGDLDLCLCLSRDQLTHDIAINSSLAPIKIKQFIEYLTYGRNVTSPDQALQPFVPLGSGQLGIGGIGLLSSNVERNLLTLQARVEPSLFDSQSSLFEIEMTRQLKAVFEARWQLVTANRTFQLGGIREELDLIICEPETNTVFVLELRWILPPADPREVQNKRRACLQKVDQVERKLSAAKTNLTHLLREAFDISIDLPSSWAVCGAVIIQGYGGSLSQNEEIPIVPNWVLEAGLSTSSTLASLVKWLTSLDWLPVEGRDFNTQEVLMDLTTVKARYPGIVPLRSGREYLKDATAHL